MSSDGELVLRVRAGERSAQECLIRRWAPRVLAVCHARVGSSSIADDLAQEALLRGLSQLGSLKEPECFGSWLRSIATNVCIDWVRAKSQRPRTVSIDFVDQVGEGDESEAVGVSGEDDLVTREVNEGLRHELDQLPEDLREPVLLFYYDDESYEQIADVMGVSRATVSARLTKARQILGRKLACVVEGTGDV